MRKPEEKTRFDRIRLILRIIGIFLGTVPVLCYFIFAFTLSAIHQSYDEVTFQYTITHDFIYQICEGSLAIANVTWIYWLPIAFAIGLFDVGVSFVRQFKES
jgi:hypothetical protein